MWHLKWFYQVPKVTNMLGDSIKVIILVRLKNYPFPNRLIFAIFVYLDSGEIIFLFTVLTAPADTCHDLHIQDKLFAIRCRNNGST